MPCRAAAATMLASRDRRPSPSPLTHPCCSHLWHARFPINSYVCKVVSHVHITQVGVDTGEPMMTALACALPIAAECRPAIQHIRVHLAYVCRAVPASTPSISVCAAAAASTGSGAAKCCSPSGGGSNSTGNFVTRGLSAKMFRISLHVWAYSYVPPGAQPRSATAHHRRAVVEHVRRYACSTQHECCEGVQGEYNRHFSRHHELSPHRLCRRRTFRGWASRAAPL